MVRDLLDLCIALEIGARDVQRNIRGVNDPVQESEVLWDNTLDIFGDEDLVGIELDLVALELHLVLHLREVEDTREVEGVVYVEMNPEERLFEGLWVELMVEGDIVLVLELGRFLRPSGMNVVNLVVFVGVDISSILPLLLLAEDDGHREELAILIE